MPWWRKTVEHLKSECPITRHRLVVQRRKLKRRDHGSTFLSDSEQTITIVVNTKHPFTDQIHTLLHEWGHAMWLDRVDWHDKKWGEYHSEAYRAWERLESG